MNTATERTPLEDPLMMQLRRTLDAVEEEQAAAPAPTPPWERIQAGMGRARRYRRRARAARVGAGLLALTAAGAGVGTGVVPYPSFAPTVPIPGSAGRSALDDGRTRGSLAGDQAWLQALREQVAAGETRHEAGGEFWAPPAARNVSVIYAGDVGAYRIALVEGNWHWGPIAARQQVWFQARAGAPASAMVKGANGGPRDVAVAVVQPSSTRELIDASAVVVVSATPRRVVLDGPPTIDAQAKVTRHAQVLPGLDGVYAAPVTARGQSSLTVAGLRYSNLLAGSAQDYDSQPVAAQSPVRGGAVQPKGPLRRFAADIWMAARQPIGSGDRFQLVAVEATARPMTNGPVYGVVGLVTLPNGARVLAAGERAAGSSAIQLSAGRLLPAGSETSDMSIAWRKPARAADPGWTVAMGPIGTVRMQWIHRDGSITSGGAENTVAATEHDDVTEVRFLDAAGGRIGTATVLAPIDNRDVGVLPEVAPETSVAGK